MLYLNYWELNEKIDPVELGKLGMKMAELSDIEGVETLSWVITPDFWGMSLLKVENEEAAFRMVTRWRVAMPGIFKKWKAALAMEVAESIPIVMSVAKELGK